MKNITVKNFIENYLIEQIAEIKEEHPYFAFLLIAIGIEFLGKCMNTEKEWQTEKKSRKDFDGAINALFPKKYKTMKLYDNLRCGLGHAFCPDDGLKLTDGKIHSSALSCDELYCDFKMACEKVLNGEVALPTKKLTDIFLTVNAETNGMNSTTGSPKTTKTLKL